MLTPPSPCVSTGGRGCEWDRGAWQCWTTPTFWASIHFIFRLACRWALVSLTVGSGFRPINPAPPPWGIVVARLVDRRRGFWPLFGEVPGVGAAVGSPVEDSEGGWVDSTAGALGEALPRAAPEGDGGLLPPRGAWTGTTSLRWALFLAILATSRLFLASSIVCALASFCALALLSASFRIWARSGKRGEGEHTYSPL